MRDMVTIRVSRQLRDEIARLAEARDSTMLEVLAEAVDGLAREAWWASVHDALDGLPSADVDGLAAESRVLDRTAGDGLS